MVQMYHFGDAFVEHVVRTSPPPLSEAIWEQLALLRQRLRRHDANSWAPSSMGAWRYLGAFTDTNFNFPHLKRFAQANAGVNAGWPHEGAGLELT